jgi:hypothetical protein
MVLLQISITTSNNNTYIPINLVGICNIKILSIQYNSTDGAGTIKIIGINTDKLRMNASQYPYPIFMNGAQGNFFGFDNSHTEYHFIGVDMDGRMFVNIIDVATGTQPVNFTNCLVTFDIEKIVRL